jgi:hypothetical protein
MSIQGQDTNWASDYLDQFDKKSNSAQKLLGRQFLESIFNALF